MRLFECQACGQALYFENVLCESCGRKLGYLPKLSTLSALEPEGDKWRALADAGALYRHCANVAHETCNWLISDDSDEPFCLACRHNRTIPNLSEPRNLAALAQDRTRQAPAVLQPAALPAAADHEGKGSERTGLRFSRCRRASRSLTGHLDGTITINHHRGRRRASREAARRDGRALPDPARAFPARDRALLLGSDRARPHRDRPVP